MSLKPDLTSEQKRRCQELAELFVSNEEFWPQYLELVNGLQGLDLDGEFSSPQVQSYIVFMGNQVGNWLRVQAPEIHRETAAFLYFKKLITDAATATKE